MNMIRFEHIEFLYGLLLIPLLIALYLYIHKRQTKLIGKFSDSILHAVLMPAYSGLKKHLKFGIFLTSIFFLMIALANPQVGTKVEEVKQVGFDVYILLDVSKSMQAEDIKPNRLEKAKYEISKLIRRLQGDRLGLIVFAGRAYIQFPLTTDYNAANLFLNAVDVNSVPQQGTAIAAAIDLALNSFKYDDPTQKAIILITDGEDHEGDIDASIEKAKDKDVVIYSIGLGSASGVPIPVYNQAGVCTGYKKDTNGEIVLTRLNDEILKKIAGETGGKYYHGTNTEDELEAIYNDLAKIEATEYGAKRITDYEDRFYYFLAPAIILLLLDFLISYNKSRIAAKIVNMREVSE